MSDRNMLSGAQHLTPLTQGSLSSLCGLYSVINGIQLALYPDRLAKADLRALYRHGLAYLARRRKLQGIMEGGMSEKDWLSLGAQLIQHANSTQGTNLKLVPIAGKRRSIRRETMFMLIEQHIEAGSPVLIKLDGAHSHLTVVAGTTERRLVLFDSHGLHWLTFERVGLSVDGNAWRHGISPTSAVAIVDDW